MTNLDIKKWSTAKLKAEYKSLYSLIHKEDCYGVNDMVLLEWVRSELFGRGIAVVDGNTISFKNHA